MKALVIAAICCLVAVPAFAGGDPVAGEQVYKRCLPCHAIGDGAPNKVGPELNGVVGATAGNVPDYLYSSALRAAGGNGLVWTPGELSKLLSERSGDYLAGVKMTFAGIKKPEDVQNLIAYLEVYSPDWQHPAAPPPPPGQ